MARSAHRVFIVAPDADLVGPQPPLAAGSMLAGLVQVGRDLLPGIEFTLGLPDVRVDLVVALGDTPAAMPARRHIRLNAEPWAGMIEHWTSPRRRDASWWPFGGLAAAALAAGEAFKVAMLKLLPHAINPKMTAAVFAPTDAATFRLAADTPYALDLGEVDFISGGAINSGALYALARLPAVRLRGRVIEPDHYASSNLNRYSLMLAHHDGLDKAPTLSSLLHGGIPLEPIVMRYALGSSIEPLASQVVIGVDDIPTRWHVQRSNPDWLAIGASTHWSAMASIHEPGLGCAQCLHPEDDPGDAPIPTQACVSFWGGLLVAAYLSRHAAGRPIPAARAARISHSVPPRESVYRCRACPA